MGCNYAGVWADSVDFVEARVYVGKSVIPSTKPDFLCADQSNIHLR